MKLEDLKPACTIHVDAAGRTMKEWSFPPNHLPAGQHKLYTLEQLLPIIHEMAREQLKLETELTKTQHKYDALLDYLKTAHDFRED